MQINLLIILHYMACKVPPGCACVSSRLGVHKQQGQSRCAPQASYHCHGNPLVQPAKSDAQL